MCWAVSVGLYVLGGMCWAVCVGLYVLGCMCWAVCVGLYVQSTESKLTTIPALDTLYTDLFTQYQYQSV